MCAPPTRLAWLCHVCAAFGSRELRKSERRCPPTKTSRHRALAKRTKLLPSGARRGVKVGFMLQGRQVPYTGVTIARFEDEYLVRFVADGCALRPSRARARVRPLRRYRSRPAVPRAVLRHDSAIGCWSSRSEI